MAQTPDCELADRISKLEARARLWRAAVLGVALLASAPWLIGVAESGGSDAVRVSSLTLVGPDGAECGVLKTVEGSPVLTLRDGPRHVTLTLASGTAGLACGGPQGVAFAGVSSAGAYFNARGPDLRSGVFAGVAAEGDAAFRAYGSELRVAASLGADASGAPAFLLSDPKRGETRWPDAWNPRFDPK